MCAALTDCDARNLCAAVLARFSFTVVHPKIVLEFSAAIDTVDGCAVAADAFVQHLAYRFM